MITLRNIRAGYGERVALRDLSCSLRTHRTTAVLGPDGSGKSTLLRVLAGADAPTCAEAWYDGRLTGVVRPVSVLAQRLDPGDKRMTLRALLDHHAPRERSLEQIWREPAALDVLASQYDTPIGGLPPALRRLVGLTVALARPAGLVLLDEPDAGADPDQRDWICAALSRLRGRKTLVLATQDLDLAHAVADDALLLHDGVLVAAADPPTLFHAPGRLQFDDLATDGG